MKGKSLVLSLLLAVIAAGAGFVWWQFQADAAAQDLSLEATGVIESRRAVLAPEIGGGILEVLVEEGQRVRAGEALVRLDSSLLVARRAQAQAALDVARANLALLEAGATTEQIQAAQAQLGFAEASLRGVQANLFGLTVAARPEAVAALQASLDRARERYFGMQGDLATDQVEAVRSALTAAQSNLSAAQARVGDLALDSRNPAYVLAAAEAAAADAAAAQSIAQQVYNLVRSEAIPYNQQFELALQSWGTAQGNRLQAQARYDGLVDDERVTPDALDVLESTLADAIKLEEATREAYEALAQGLMGRQLEAAWTEVRRLQGQLASLTTTGLGLSSAGTTPQATVETLMAQVEAAEAQRDLAAAQLAALERGARPEEMEAARAQVDAAQAQLDAIDVQLGKFTLLAPWDGVVLHRSAEPGETVMPGATLLEIGRLDSLELTVYLPEDRFGLVIPGQSVNVRVDVYPDRSFSGTVLRISDEAEFTPTNIQTQEDRVRLVYAVVVRLDNLDLALKPGMIADVRFDS